MKTFNTNIFKSLSNQLSSKCQSNITSQSNDGQYAHIIPIKALCCHVHWKMATNEMATNRLGNTTRRSVPKIEKIRNSYFSLDYFIFLLHFESHKSFSSHSEHHCLSIINIWMTIISSSFISLLNKLTLVRYLTFRCCLIFCLWLNKTKNDII